tara:strand:- start:377 stop:820 length:444 start_codon:yes stop_codon:yes gene_type:complete
MVFYKKRKNLTKKKFRKTKNKKTLNKASGKNPKFFFNHKTQEELEKSTRLARKLVEESYNPSEKNKKEFQALKEQLKKKYRTEEESNTAMQRLEKESQGLINRILSKSPKIKPHPQPDYPLLQPISSKSLIGLPLQVYNSKTGYRKI